jgi:hypothetical protein
MNNTVMRKVNVTAGYQSLVAQQLIATVEISALPSNTGPVFFLGDDGSDVPWIPGEYHTLNSVNLAEIKIKGTPGDAVSIVGGTW